MSAAAWSPAIVNLAVTQPLGEAFRYGPAIFQRLQFGRRAEVLEKGPALGQVPQAQQGAEQFVFSRNFLAGAQDPVVFHGSGLFKCINMLVHWNSPHKPG